ncbi:MAG: helicase-exonuclease AddAB subunit AddA [Oscillospiraceae bacterium]|jgi:ATP-dependent helicase/nuclease subunit A|nr:helicase-exonuclease AddAB subunit AddA [Oscillospiraceae bacterium]
MAKIEPTPEQFEAMTHMGEAILVSAGAGSGKTRVLVERLMRQLENPDADVSVTDFLIITFTNNAAAELRERVGDEISERLAADPTNRRLRRQALLVSASHIMTIHGFCLELLRENAHVLGLAPDFRVADADECAIIQAETLNEVLDARYETILEDADFAELVDTMSAGRDDSRLADIVLNTYDKLQANADPAGWIRDRMAELAFETVADAGDTRWGRLLLDNALAEMRYWREWIESVRGDATIEKSYGAQFDVMTAFCDALKVGWDATASAAVSLPKAVALSGEDYADVRESRLACKTAYDKLRVSFAEPSRKVLDDLLAVRPALRGLFALVEDFGKAYGEAKRRRGIVDFSDQEHMALRLLTDEDGEPTAFARVVRERFREVMVDEYQDVNEVQERIFSAVSREGRNVFMVGDVKQSIYRFRLADPNIFLGKYRDFAKTDGGGKRILLSKNFRSRKNVLDAVNFVFENIMSVEYGEMEYGENEKLLCGRDDDTEGHSVEIDVIDLPKRRHSADENEDSPDNVELAAAFVARRIDELISGGFEVPVKDGGVRCANYGDVAILLRAFKGKAAAYRSALAARAIPVEFSERESFFDTTEITVALSLLEVIDNPKQDVPLIATLRGPIYAFSADKLAGIRLLAPSEDFLTALNVAAETDEDARRFLDELNAFRALAPELPTDKFLWHVYNRTGLPAIVGAMTHGAERRDNLTRLIDHARRFEGGGYKGLFGFITHVRRLREAGRDLTGGAETQGTGAVQLLTMHKSKGLEFPIVFLADMTKGYNRLDLTAPLLIHPKLGVGAKRVNRERRIAFPTIARRAISAKLTEELRAEELRVLYVAMTRAREKLVIVGSHANATAALDKLRASASTPVEPRVLRGTSCLLDMILLAQLTVEDADKLWDLRVITDVSGAGETAVSDDISAPATPELSTVNSQLSIDEVAERLSFKYPYPSAAQLPSKLTATELKGRFRDGEVAEDADTLVKAAFSDIYAKPAFLSAGDAARALTGAERGTALHAVMQHVEFGACATVEGARGEVARLLAAGIISREQADAADCASIAAFVSSELGAKVLGAERVYREFKFSLLVRAEELIAGGGEDEILFQGVIDLIADDGETLTVVDFKTDRVTDATLAAKAEDYTAQISSYCRAITRITGKPVSRGALYFFALNRAVDIVNGSI